ncbi:MAG: HipA N-terminal domain-containing protein [Bacteroidales bacterium]|nr:HipA N-terminal domain-containing protein [Bacteroidales bacterium]
MRQLGVYCNGKKAGVLTEKLPGREYEFIYDPDYLLSGGPSISVTLPRRKEAYESAELFPFFTNMLPEGSNRSIICRSLKIDEEDFFGMLAAMAGRDFIGAVHIKALQ